MADLVHLHDLFFKTIFSHLDLVEDALTRVGLLILKHIYDDDFDKKFPEIFGLLQGIKINEKSLNLIIGALKYVTGTTNKISKENIQREVQRVLPGQREKIMPRLADQWIEAIRTCKRKARRKKRRTAGGT